MNWKQKRDKIWNYAVYPMTILIGIIELLEHNYLIGVLFICISIIGWMDRYELLQLKATLK